MYNLIKKRFWWFWLILTIVLLVLLTKNLEAQDVDETLISYSYFTNGLELYIGEEPIIFIYGNQMFGFKDGMFQAVTSIGDTLEIKIKRKQR